MLAGDVWINMVDHDLPEIEEPDTCQQMSRMLLSSSCGKIWHRTHNKQEWLAKGQIITLQH